MNSAYFSITFIALKNLPTINAIIEFMKLITPIIIEAKNTNLLSPLDPNALKPTTKASIDTDTPKIINSFAYLTMFSVG